METARELIGSPGLSDSLDRGWLDGLGIEGVGGAVAIEISTHEPTVVIDLAGDHSFLGPQRRHDVDETAIDVQERGVRTREATPLIPNDGAGIVDARQVGQE